MACDRLIPLLLAPVAFAIAMVMGSGARASEPLSFELDIQPILTAHSCNSGGCHGKQRGQNGFQLSLFAFDSDFDHAALTRDARGRRIFLASPTNSLIISKATAEVPHGGGRKIEVGSEDYYTLVKWIEQGATRFVANEPVLERVSLETDDFSLKPNESRPLRVTAHYSDGSTRDVTRLTTFLSNEDAVVSVDDNGLIRAGDLPGETSVMARFMNHIQVANVAIPQLQSLAPEIVASLKQNNFVDTLIDEKLVSLGIEPSPVVGDDVFLRRVTLDLNGRLPTVDETREFLGSTAPEKRAALVNRLLDRPEFADHWSGYWADLLRPNPYRVGIKAVLNYDNWIRQQFRENVSYDQFVTELITAKGSTWQNGATTLFRDRRSPEEMTTLVSQLFLGIRLECAKCHHHPFERWSQKDFYQFAAFFANVNFKGTGLSPPISGGEETVFSGKQGAVKHPLTGETMTPTPLFELGSSIDSGSAAKPDATEPATSDSSSGESVDPRQRLAEWITSTSNEFFAQVQVNRTWAILMGRGMVEPVDDLRTTNPPSHPKLLGELARDFQDSGYDFKHLLRTITLSRVYSHSSDPTPSNVGDRLNYARHYRSRLRAEVLMDAISEVTEQSVSMQGLPPDSRANQVWTTRVESIFLDTFGRPNENQDPPCERIPDSTVTQALHLMNSPQLEERIGADGGRAARLAASSMSPAEITEELYLAAYTRFPTPDEREYAQSLIDSAENRRSAIEDLMWAMLNSPEFSIQN